MYIIVKVTKDNKIKATTSDKYAVMDDAILAARKVAFKADEGDELCICEIKAKVMPKLIVEAVNVQQK